MTDLLDPPGTRARRGPSGGGTAERSLAVGAAVAGAAAALVALAGCMALGLVAWFASDAGAHGTTRDALRVGTDGWLLAQGAHLRLATGSVSATVTALPLGLTLLCGYVAHRLGRRAAATSRVEDGRALLLGSLVLAGTYALVALVAALVGSTRTAEPGLLSAPVGAFVVALLGGGTGMLRSRPDVYDWRARVPEPLRVVVVGALASVLMVFAAASLLLTVALLDDFGSAANVLSRLHADVSGGLLYTVLVAAVAPNAVLLSGSYLLGPGFAVGTGTVVSPAGVTLGQVPAFPLLAALPSTGSQPDWQVALVAAPLVAAMAGTALVLRRHPVLTLGSGALRGLASGVAGGLLLATAIELAGGSVGPGRMADIGADLLDTVVSATVAMGIGGLVAGVAATWWARRS